MSQSTFQPRGADGVDGPTVSVIIPTKNVGEWIPQTVESLKGQTLSDIEVLVVDDGSTDDTVERFEEAAADDPRFRILPNPGIGGAQARNHAIAMARGEFLAFADGDDIIPSGAYRMLVEQARASGSEMVIGNHLVMEPQQITSRDRSVPLYRGVRAGITLLDEPRFLRDRVCWNRIIRRSSWHAAGLAFADSRRSNDIQAMTHAYCAFAFDVIPEPVYAYRRRIGRTSMTWSKHQPGPLLDHFRQELACLEPVRRLADERVLEQYFAGILEFDIWAHGVVAIESDGDEFEEVRDLLVELVTAAPQRARDRLPLRPRLAYGLVAKRQWELARLILGEPGVAMAEALERIDVETLIRASVESDPGSHEALADLVRTACLAPIANGTADEGHVGRLHALAQRMHRAGIVDQAFTRRELHLLAIEDDIPVEELRLRAVEALPAETLQSAVTATREALARVRRGGARELLRVAARVRPRHVLVIARETRPRHLAAAARSAARIARRRLGR
ncbi:glycosyltransferase family 2 protein [Agrococcus terreus]|uniref:Glycosyltransferase 2-like domain-containing protein n=1 Tax=Agrococcus terreus TaxID=574649 RepID=A0ABQ2KDJ3_9MICO|nr:glycosyltransferase family 2 protein [Agrococcus terreus]GGN80327.1 hypothetical protein GCM10010968_08070 [Agrococcus terreus]